MSGIYYCTNKNNTCELKDECKRYEEAKKHNHATLFKVMCTPENNHILFIKSTNNEIKCTKTQDEENKENEQ